MLIIFLPLNMFFWVVKVSVKNVVAWRLTYVVVATKTLWPKMNVTSSRQIGVMLDLDLV